MRGTRVPMALLSVAMLVSGCRSLPAAGTARQRALILTQAIEEDFWEGRRKAYLDVSPRRAKGLPYAMMWANGVQFTVLSGAVSRGATEYAPHMREFLTGMETYWNARRKMYSAYFGGTEDVYYDDNQWMILAYVEAYEVTGDEAYLRKAEAVADGCLTGVDDVRGGGSYWHLNRKKYPTKNTCANAPLATALLRLRPHLVNRDKQRLYLEQAEAILAWTRDVLQDGRGLMLDNINVKTGKITNWTFTYNTALMIQGWLELYEVSRNPKHLAEAIKLGKAASHWLKADGPVPDQNHYDDATFFTVHLLEALVRLADCTGDKAWLASCDATADFYWHAWRRGTSYKLLDVAAIARMQWVLANEIPQPLAPPPPGVRYVRLEAKGKGKPLVLAEVEILVDGKNVAPTGKAYQSTTIDNAFAEYAVDGAIDSVSCTDRGKGSAWWELELPRPVEIETVRVHPHGDGEPAMADATLVLLNEHRQAVRSGSPGFMAK